MKSQWNNSWRMAARLGAMAFAAAIGLAAPAISSALEPEDLVGTWEFKLTKQQEPTLTRSIEFVLDVWSDGKGNLDGYYAGLGVIRPAAEFKIDGDKFSCKILHPNTKPGTLGGPVKDGVATLTLDESHSGAAPETRDYRRLPLAKASASDTAPMNESYSGNFANDIVVNLPNPVKFKAGVSFVTAVKKEKQEIGGSVTLNGAKTPLSLIRRSQGRIYLEWPDKANTDGELGRFLGVIKDGQLVGQIDSGVGKGYVALAKEEEEPLPGKP